MRVCACVCVCLAAYPRYIAYDGVGDGSYDDI